MTQRLARRLARSPLVCVFLLLGVALCYAATRLSMRTLDGGPGPGLLPAALGALMTVLALWVLWSEPPRVGSVGSVGPVGPGGTGELSGAPRFSALPTRVAAMAGGLALYAAVLEALGFVIATAALVGGLLALFNERNRGRLAALGLAGAAGAYWVFHTLLRVPLPADPAGLWR